MIKKKRISTTIPEKLLAEAVKATRSGQTETIILALQELIRAHKRASVVNLRGKLSLSFDVNKERQRERF